MRARNTSARAKCVHTPAAEEQQRTGGKNRNGKGTATQNKADKLDMQRTSSKSTPSGHMVGTSWDMSTAGNIRNVSCSSTIKSREGRQTEPTCNFMSARERAFVSCNAGSELQRMQVRCLALVARSSRTLQVSLWVPFFFRV